MWAGPGIGRLEASNVMATINYLPPPPNRIEYPPRVMALGPQETCARSQQSPLNNQPHKLPKPPHLSRQRNPNIPALSLSASSLSPHSIVGCAHPWGRRLPPTFLHGPPPVASLCCLAWPWPSSSARSCTVCPSTGPAAQLRRPANGTADGGSCPSHPAPPHASAQGLDPHWHWLHHAPQPIAPRWLHSPVGSQFTSPVFQALVCGSVAAACGGCAYPRAKSACAPVCVCILVCLVG